MGEAQAAGIMVLLFALRCIVPLVLISGIGYFTNRLVDHWEAEAAEGKSSSKQRPPAVAAQSSLSLPCWLVRNCDPATRSSCAAARETSKPCWVARTAQEGALPTGCSACPIYNGQQLAI